jgi:hypothetical protein
MIMMKPRLKEDHALFVFDGKQVIGPLEIEDLVHFVEKGYLIEGDTFTDVAETGGDNSVRSEVVCSFNLEPQPSLPLFDREPSEHENTGAGEASEDRTSTYGGL